jgi:AAA15 family ATPase/GTPase
MKAPLISNFSKIQGVDQQKLLGLYVESLKNLKDVDLDFSLSPLTAIMGSNCCGKTTVLHAIACAFSPLKKGDPDYRFPLFFRPNSDAHWRESKFSISYSERQGPVSSGRQTQNYGKLTDRWSPRYHRRPVRYTRFVNIGESVPDIETVNLTSMIHYTKTESDDESGMAIRETAGQILNKQYDSLYKIKYDYRGQLSIGVKTSNLTYSGLSMSSGEQRVFRILDAVFRAPNYGLILVDEIDLFLHQDALQRLLQKLRAHCENKKKQLVFTTHFPPVAKLYDDMCIYTLNRVPSKTIIWRGYSYEAMRHITGTQERPITCYVEDDVAEQIVARVASQLTIRKFVNFGTYGPAVNAFNLCGGLSLSKQSTDHTLGILDGDVYGNRGERRNRVNSAITGNQAIHDKQRSDLMRLVRTLKPIKNANGKLLSPEQVLHRMLHGLAPETVPRDRSELHGIAMDVVNVPERHGFINQIIAHTGESREVALSKIVELASLSNEWCSYTRVVRKWLAAQKAKLEL